MGPDDITATRLSEWLGGEIGRVSHHRIGDGLVGLNLRVTLHDADPALPRSVVCKLPSLDETSRATGIALRNYEREVKFYVQVARTVDIRVPMCHHGEWDAESGDFTLVLEDMAPSVQGDQVAGCTLKDAFAAVDELARLHGPRWGDETLHDLDWLGRSDPTDVASLTGLWQMFLPGFMETYARHLSVEAQELLLSFGDRLGDWLAGRPAPLTVTHGDYRLDNLLFATTAGGPAVTAVDWQTPAHGAPIADLAYFCGAGLLPEGRREQDRALVDRYAAALAAYDVTVDDRWLWEQYGRESFAGVVMAVIASQIVGSSERSEAMFTAMASRGLQHALDLDALSLV